MGAIDNVDYSHVFKEFVAYTNSLCRFTNHMPPAAISIPCSSPPFLGQLWKVWRTVTFWQAFLTFSMILSSHSPSPDSSAVLVQFPLLTFNPLQWFLTLAPQSWAKLLKFMAQSSIWPLVQMPVPCSRFLSHPYFWPADYEMEAFPRTFRI